MATSVLIVDSNPDGREMYLTALAIEGFEARAAASASEALDVFERTRPRAVVTELRLPDTRGVDLVHRMRQEDPGAFIVGLASEGPDRGQAREAGCNVVLQVPCLPETLIRQLRRGLV
jgi:two-component system, NtrC family, C4-dicarboxylate transport response regulator DctD